MAIVTGAMVEDYLSTPVVVDTLDDNNDGTIDINSMARVLADAEALFLASVRGTYAMPFVAPYDALAVTVILMLVHCQLVKRFPERFKRGVKICEEAKELLDQIRKGELQLDHPLKSTNDGPECFSLPQRMPETYTDHESDAFYVADND